MPMNAEARPPANLPVRAQKDWVKDRFCQKIYECDGVGEDTFRESVKRLYAPRLMRGDDAQAIANAASLRKRERRARIVFFVQCSKLCDAKSR